MIMNVRVRLGGVMLLVMATGQKLVQFETRLKHKTLGRQYRREETGWSTSRRVARREHEDY